MDQTTRETLSRILGQSDTILFIGSGISSWSGLPTWGGMISELADYLDANSLPSALVREELANKELLQAASYGFQDLTIPQILAFMRAACRTTKARPSDLHELIVSLGPRSFITTNYDQLIEQSLTKWTDDPNFTKATNRQPIEIADIVQARSTNFIFKPHGDITDARSIILTREQYRVLLPGGEYHTALDALKTLMISRPIVYIGFGLRDPDFIYVKDLLANTYNGGARDHYAFVADPNDQQTRYWRENYGLHLIGYKTDQTQTGVLKHGDLKTQLGFLISKLTEAPLPQPEPSAINAESFILPLMRHASRLARLRSDDALPLEVSAVSKQKGRRRPHSDRFDGASISSLLSEGPHRYCIIGLPGSGKSFSVKNFVADLGVRFHDDCLKELPISEMVVPVFVDLKLYEGRLVELIELNLPAGVTWEVLRDTFKVSLILDAVNEIPSEYLEGGAWAADLSMLLSMDSPSVILTSRTSDALGSSDLPVYEIGNLTSDFVHMKLKERGIDVAESRLYTDYQLLRKPLFFNLMTEGKLPFTVLNGASDIYESFFLYLDKSFSESFGKTLNLRDILTQGAYDALDRGEETITYELLKTSIASYSIACTLNIDEEDLVNWMIGKGIIIPYPNARLAFFHQSITEYLAARSVADRYLHNEGILQEILRSRRWDQAVFFALSLLPSSEATKALEYVMEVDIRSAGRALRYIEDGHVGIAKSFLEKINARFNRDSLPPHDLMFSLSRAISEIPILDHNLIAQLKLMVEIGDTLGAAAAARLYVGNVLSFVECAKLIEENWLEYNFCGDLADALKHDVAAADIPFLHKLAVNIQQKFDERNIDDPEPFVAAANALGVLMKGLELGRVFDAFYTNEYEPSTRTLNGSILHNILREHSSVLAIELSLKLLADGDKRAASTLYFITQFREVEHDAWAVFKVQDMERLLVLLQDSDEGGWSVEAVRNICGHRHDLLVFCRDWPNSRSVLTETFIAFATDGLERLFECLENVYYYCLEKSPKDEEFGPFHHLRIDWSGHESLFLRFLKLRNTALAYSLIEGVSEWPGFLIGKIEFDDVDWLLSWLEDVPSETLSLFPDRLGRLIAATSTKVFAQSLIEEFNRPGCVYRLELARYVLPHLDWLTTSEFSESAVEFLLSEAALLELSWYDAGVLGHTATEVFIKQRILPLLPVATEKVRGKLGEILREAGKRHGHRYFPDGL